MILGRLVNEWLERAASASPWELLRSNSSGRSTSRRALPARSVEVSRRFPILYACGDFVDDSAVDPSERNDESLILEIVLRFAEPSGKAFRTERLPDLAAGTGATHGGPIPEERTGSLCAGAAENVVRSAPAASLPAGNSQEIAASRPFDLRERLPRPHKKSRREEAKRS